MSRGCTRDVDRSSAVLVVDEYESAGGKEFFISFVDKEKDILFGFIRLRFPGDRMVFPELRVKTALIRELHVYGSVVSVNSKDDKKTQHHGFGKKLLKRAESIAWTNGYEYVAIISGVGVRDYYRKFGYRLVGEGEYMIKSKDDNPRIIWFHITFFLVVLFYVFYMMIYM
jgi:Histone acetyltransferase